MATNTNDMYPAMTVKQLKKFCEKAIKEGHGDKKILISCDEEGNGYHGLFYQFTTSPEDIRTIQQYGIFQDEVDPDDIVLLG